MTRCAKAAMGAWLAMATACGGADGGGDDPGVASSQLDVCLGGGGALAETTRVDNNVLTAHGDVTAVAFAASGQMALGSTDGAIKLWSIRAEAQGTIAPDLDYDAAFGEDAPPARALAYGPGAAWIASGRDGGVVELWEPTTGALMDGATWSESAVTALDVAPDGAMLAVAHEGAEMHLWAPGELPGARLDTGLWDTTSVRYLPDGRMVTAGHFYLTPMVELRAADGAVVWTWNDELRQGWVRDVAVSPDGDHLAAAGDEVLLLFDLAAGDPSAPLVIEVEGALASAAYSPGGEHVVAVDAAGAVRVFDAASGAELTGMPAAGIAAVRAQPAYDQLVAFERGGIVRMLGCAP